MAARERVKELLKNSDLSMRDIAKMVGVSYQRVSQIYRTELEISNKDISNRSIPIRKQGRRILYGNRTYKKICSFCKKKFVTHIRNIKYCSRECVTSSQTKVLPDNLPELFINCSSSKKLSEQLGVSIPTIHKRLVRDYGFTKETFKKYDRRYKK